MRTPVPALLTLLSLLGAPACDSALQAPSGAAESAVAADDLVRRGVLALDGWSYYLDSEIYDAESVADLTPGGASPESAVVHFYAARVRGDDRWREVLAPPDKLHPFIHILLDEYDTWRFEAFRLEARDLGQDGRAVVRIWLSVSVRGEQRELEAAVGVVRDRAEWFVRHPPALPLEHGDKGETW